MRFHPLHPRLLHHCIYDIKFGILQRENVVTLHKWLGGTAHFRTLEVTLFATIINLLLVAAPLRDMKTLVTNASYRSK